VPNPVPVLLYHSVSASPADWIAPFAVSPETFAAHLDAVLASGRVPLTVSQYADGLLGLTDLPSRPVLITVDDGFADFADHALPELTKRRLVSTLYVTTGALAGDRKETVLPAADMLRHADLPGLEAAGVEIGAHSHTHRQMDLLPERECQLELVRSGAMLADILGHRVRSFAYPHGYWKARVRRQVATAGFDSACGVANVLSSGRDHPLALSRLMVRSDTDLATVDRWLGPAAVPGVPHRVPAYGWRQCRRVIHRHQARAWLA
jgi:peptidoglycan/xylan/chitin deacetylase (PgdA/CDA1 family)